MDVIMLLCDSAEAVNGKLYILGGGWSVIYAANVPVPTAVAVKLAIPWDQANRTHEFRAELLTEDGEPVDLGAGPVSAMGNFEAGRPPGVKPGTDLDAAFVMNFGALIYPAGGYVWRLLIDEEPRARAPFRVLPNPFAVPGTPS